MPCCVDEEWQQLRYIIFDAPDQRGSFEDRLSHIYQLAKDTTSTTLRAHAHEVCSSTAHLQRELARIETLGGEGVMLRAASSSYATGRSSTLLKVKTMHDAEGKVIAHEATSILVQALGDSNGVGAGAKFKLGTGFSDEQRNFKKYFPLGTIVTFKYQVSYQSLS